MLNGGNMEVTKLEFILVIFVIFLIGFIVGLEAIQGQQQEPKEILIHHVSDFDERIIKFSLPAVDSKGQGVIGHLYTTVKPGSGLVLVNINDILANVDTQESGRIAAGVAGDYTSTNMSTLDVIYNIKANASIIEGPSAGASMAASIILALRNETYNPGVMITGTIKEDGTVGKVGSVFEKAEAAKQANASIFLVPVNQSKRFGQKRDRECRLVDSIEYCRIEYISDNMNIGETINITVKEVENIEEIMNYFLNQ